MHDAISIDLSSIFLSFSMEVLKWVDLVSTSNVIVSKDATVDNPAPTLLAFCCWKLQLLSL